MSEHYQLLGFETKYLAEHNTLLVLVKGSRIYYGILCSAFNNYLFTRMYTELYRNCDWCTFIPNIVQDDCNAVINFLQLLQNSVFINTAFGQMFALSQHWKPHFNAGRSEIGELFYQAKYHRDKAKAQELVKHFEKFILLHPTYLRSDYLLAVPYYGWKYFDLPAFLVEQLCNKLNIKNGRSFVQKIKSTKAMKNATEAEKVNIIKGAFVVSPNAPVKDNVVTP